MRVNDVMTISPTCCKPSDTLDRVAKLMLEHDCGAIPILDTAKLVGIITDRDITCRAVAAGKIPSDVPVSEAMTKTIYTIHHNEDVEAAIDLMESKQVRRLPVVNDDGAVVGVVSPSDLAPTFASSNVADFLLAVSYWTRRKALAPATAEKASPDEQRSAVGLP